MSGRSILLCVAMLLSMHARAAGIDSLDILGEWRGGEIVGNVPRPDGCVSFNWVERTVNLVQIPGRATEFRGVWTKHLTEIWIAPSGPARARCRWGSEQDFSASVEGLSRQSLEGHLDAASGKLALAPRLIDCQGKACDLLVTPAMRAAAVLDSPPDEQRFTLALIDGQLIDSPTPQQRVVLRRTGDIAADFGNANRVRDSVWGHYDNSEFDEFAKLEGSGFQATRDQVASLRASTGRFIQREPNVILFMRGPATPDGQGTRDSVLFVSHVHGADGRQGTEILVLLQEEGQWKIAFLGYD